MTKNIDNEEDVAYLFRQRYAEARLLRKLSFADIAQRSGINPSQVSHFSTGQRMPSWYNLRSLALALNVSIDYLLGISSSPDRVEPAANAR